MRSKRDVDLSLAFTVFCDVFRDDICASFKSCVNSYLFAVSEGELKEKRVTDRKGSGVRSGR